MKYLLIEPNGLLLGLVESENGPDSVRQAFKDFSNTPSLGIEVGSDEHTAYMDKFFGDRGVTRILFDELQLLPEDMLSAKDIEIARRHGVSLDYAYEAITALHGDIGGA